MPYARVRTSEDVLDGSVQVEIVVPTEEDERSKAWEMEAQKPLYRALLAGSVSLLLVGCGMYLSEVVRTVPIPAAHAI
jgi:hypothetical protein